MNATVEISSVLFETAVEKLKSGFYPAAIDGFTAFLKEKPLDAQALQGRAQAYFKLQDWAQAEKNYALAKTLDPSDAENWMGLAACMVMQNRTYMAIDQYEELLLDKPSYVPAHFQLGVLYFKIGDVGKARACLHGALGKNPTPSQRKIIELTLQDEEERGVFSSSQRSVVIKSETPGINRWWRRMVQSVVGY